MTYLSDSQFNEFIDTIKSISNVDANFWSVLSSLAPIAIIVASAASIFIAFRILGQSKNLAVAKYIYDSDTDYEKLDKQLKFIGDWSKEEHNKKLIEIYRNMNLDMISDDILSKYPVDQEIWSQARIIKKYFKRSHTLWRTKLISDDNLLKMINRGGYNLLLNVVWPLNIYQVFYLDKPGNIPVNEKHFKAEFRWIRELKEEILDKYDPSIVRAKSSVKSS